MSLISLSDFTLKQLIKFAIDRFERILRHGGHIQISKGLQTDLFVLELQKSLGLPITLVDTTDVMVGMTLTGDVRPSNDDRFVNFRWALPSGVTTDCKFVLDGHGLDAVVRAVAEGGMLEKYFKSVLKDVDEATPDSDICILIQKVLDEVHGEIKDCKISGGTTLSGIVQIGGRIFVCNTGDSRTFWRSLRKIVPVEASSPNIEEVTHDQKPNDDIAKSVGTFVTYRAGVYRLVNIFKTIS